MSEEVLEPERSFASPSRRTRDQVRFENRPEEFNVRDVGVSQAAHSSGPAPRKYDQASSEVVLAQALTQIVNQLQRMQSASPAVRVVCRAHFSGEETEDPRLFIMEMRRFFARGNIDDPIEQTHQALERLQGRAASWGRNFKIFQIPFSEFARRLLETFDSLDTQVKVRAQFYGQKQCSGEAADAFIARKRALAARMSFRDQLAEETTVQSIITLLLPELRSRLRLARIATMEELVGAATLLEEDLAEERRTRSQPSAARPPAGGPTNRSIQQSPRPANQLQVTARGSERRPAGCFVCGGPHMARDCPHSPRALMPPPPLQINAVSQETNSPQQNRGPKNGQRADDARDQSAQAQQPPQPHRKEQ